MVEWSPKLTPAPRPPYSKTRDTNAEFWEDLKRRGFDPSYDPVPIKGTKKPGDNAHFEGADVPPDDS